MDAFDVVIVGAGPGGSTAATMLARDGLAVLVLEKERFPRFRIGESLLPMSRAIYARLGVADEMDRRFIHKHGAHIVQGDGSREQIIEFGQAMDCPFGYAYHVPRAEHDALLLDNARRAGAVVREGVLVDDVLWEGDRAVGVRVRPADDGAGPREEIRAGHVVDASGRVAFLGRRLKLLQSDPLLSNAAVFSHYRGVTRLPGLHEGSITVGTFEGGWLWLIPFAGEITSVGAVMHHTYWRERKRPPEQLLEEALDACPPVRERLRHAERVMPVHAEGSFSYKARQFAGPGWFLCGDAAAFLDPVFSSGVLFSMSSALHLSELILRERREPGAPGRFAREYEGRVNDGMSAFWRFVYGFYDPAFFDLFMQPTNKFRLQDAVAGVLAGNLAPGLRLKTRLWTMDALVGANRIVRRMKGDPLVPGLPVVGQRHAVRP